MSALVTHNQAGTRASTSAPPAWLRDGLADPSGHLGRARPRVKIELIDHVEYEPDQVVGGQAGAPGRWLGKAWLIVAIA